jgi:UDP-N-acetylmuramoyl-L-alanyl-D-glutamate--2,6-diaminopimelate ligase
VTFSLGFTYDKRILNVIYSDEILLCRRGTMTCVIADLLKDWPCTWIQGSFSHPIKGITDDSRRIKKGDVFVAINGRNENGTNYINDAIRRGAVCVISEEKLPIDPVQEIAYATVPNTKTFLSHASSRVYGNPSNQLHIIGVTGTNGKTTVSHLIGQLLKAQGLKVAVIGTLGLYIDGHKAKEVPSQLGPHQYFMKRYLFV